jgi:hypothetical protein
MFSTLENDLAGSAFAPLLALGTFSCSENDSVSTAVAKVVWFISKQKHRQVDAACSGQQDQNHDEQENSRFTCKNGRN